MARAVYSEADIFLFDDPLSAVDSGVAQHLINYCFLDILKNKTIVLITHHFHLFQKRKGRLITLYSIDQGKISQESTQFLESDNVSNESGVETSQISFILSDHEKKALLKSTQDALYEKQQNRLVEEEKRNMGTIDSSVLNEYIKRLGKYLFIYIILSLILMQASKNGNDIWTTYWVNNISSKTSDSLFNLKILAIISGLNSFFTLIRSFLFAYGGIKAAKKTFVDLLERVVNAPVGFFESNPLGRILNRFSTDTYSIDDQFPFMSNIFLAQIFQILGSLVIILTAQWYLIILILPLLLFYQKIQDKYRVSSRELKRLDSVTNSPLFQNFQRH